MTKREKQALIGVIVWYPLVSRGGFIGLIAAVIAVLCAFIFLHD